VDVTLLGCVTPAFRGSSGRLFSSNWEEGGPADSVAVSFDEAGHATLHLEPWQRFAPDVGAQLVVDGYAPLTVDVGGNLAGLSTCRPRELAPVPQERVEYEVRVVGLYGIPRRFEVTGCLGVASGRDGVAVLPVAVTDGCRVSATVDGHFGWALLPDLAKGPLYVGPRELHPLPVEQQGRRWIAAHVSGNRLPGAEVVRVDGHEVRGRRGLELLRSALEDHAGSHVFELRHPDGRSLDVLTGEAAEAAAAGVVPE
jgi:hypothetical protein